MSGPHLARLREIVLTAADLAEPQRSRYLDAACGADADLRAHAERLLAADPGYADRLAPGLTNLVASMVAERPNSDLPGIGDALGPYRLERLLGSGGSGTVFEASQESPVRRRVAVKLLLRNRPFSADLIRFRAEQQILAQLDHPHIAKVFDAGTTDAGVPYFVMELIGGEPITRHVRSAGLPNDMRLALCLQAIRAAEHAHAKGVIHRDLKPSNILVSRGATGDLVKVIDFGIARLLEAEGGEPLTLEGLYLGTPEYMSPEQAGGARTDCDVRTDVHALGNLIQEVLCGRGVYDVSKMGTSSQLRVVAAGQRQLAVRDESGRPLPADLRGIIAMATEPDPQRRYRTVAELADDVERFRGRRPVLARRTGAWYTMRMAAARHPATAALLLALVMVVFGSLGALTHLNARERAAAREARREAARTQGVATYLQNLLETARPAQLGPQVTLVDAFRDAARKAEFEFEREPDILVSVLRTIARVESSLDRGDSALVTIDKAEMALARDPARTEADRLALRVMRAHILSNLGRLAEGDAIFDEVIEAARGSPELGNIEAAGWLRRGQGHLVRGEFKEGREAAERAFALLRADPRADRHELISATRLQATCMANLGARGQAEALMRAELAACERDLGRNHPATIAVLGDLAYVIGYQTGNDILELQNEALVRTMRLLGPDHLNVATRANNLASTMMEAGYAAEALPYMEQAVSIWRRRYGEWHPHLATAHNNLGYANHLAGRLEEAERHFRQALLTYERLAQPGLAVAAVNARANLATVMLDMGRLSEAETTVRAGLATLSAGQSDRLGVGWAHYTLGTVLLETGRATEAVSSFRESERILTTQDKRPENLAFLTLNGIGCALAATDWSRAEPLLREAEPWLLGPHETRHRRVQALQRTAAVLIARGESERAAPYTRLAVKLAVPAGPAQ